jgi:hypothetical protein
LASAPKLTSLYLSDTDQLRNRSRLGAVLGCRELTTLRIDRPALYGGAFLKFFTRPSIQQQIRQLTLSEFHAAGHRLISWYKSVPAADYAAAFAGLHALHSLTLRRVTDIDSMLPHVALAPSLRVLHVWPGCPAVPHISHLAEPQTREESDCNYSASTNPSLAAWIALLASAPHLRARLQFTFTSDWLPREFRRTRVAPLEAEFGERFALQFRVL